MCASYKTHLTDSLRPPDGSQIAARQGFLINGGDASRRRKNPLLVLIAVVFFFPFGLLAWLFFRPSAFESHPLNRFPTKVTAFDDQRLPR